MRHPDAHADPRRSRREFLALGIGAFVVAALPAAALRRRGTVRRAVPVMGTVAEFAVVHPDPGRAHAAIDVSIEELVRVERLMTRFSVHSDVGRANLHAAAGPVPVARATAAVLEEALRWAHATGGRFDPCLARATGLWDVTHRDRPPDAIETRRFARRGLFRALELERRGGEPVVLLHDPDAGIDLGGIAKGWAVDRAVDALRARGIRDALVNVGGDLYALGVSPEGDPWEIGIRSAADSRRLAATVRIADRAVATSGDYERFFDHDGRRYHHLLDPATGEPRTAETHGITIAAEHCVTADAAATAAFGLSRAAAERLLAWTGAEIIHIG